MQTNSNDYQIKLVWLGDESTYNEMLELLALPDMPDKMIFEIKDHTYQFITSRERYNWIMGFRLGSNNIEVAI